MKKIFTFVAAVVFAVSASAAVIWSESLDKNGSYINKADFGGNWPYATQWYEAGNFVYAYDSVGSYGVSVRNKKLNGADENSIGFFFSKDKAAESDYLYLGGKEGAIVEGAKGCKLLFDVCSSEANGGTLAEMAIEVNGVALEIPATELGNKLVTSAVELPLADGNIESLKITFDNVPTQKFIANLRIEGEEGTAHGTGGITPPVQEIDTVTVAEALEIAKALTPEKGKSAVTAEKYAVVGYVVGISTKNEKTYYLADEAGAYGEFEAYKCASIDAEVAEGDFVIVTGKIQHYWGEGSSGEFHSYEISGGDLVHGEAPEGIENIELTKDVQKVMVDGVMYIVRDGKMFNVQGAQVR